MITDVVWQQFLFFCHRNGLYYGEQLDDPTALCWTDDDSCKVVRSLNKHDHSTTDSTTLVANAGVVPFKDQRIMVVSSLERYLRN